MSTEVVRGLEAEVSPIRAGQLDVLPSIPLLGNTGVEILGVREGGLVECYIPTGLIDHEEVPVKEEWAADIARQMRERMARKGGSGQKTPIQTGWIEGETLFKIVDGFHRDAALINNAESRIYCTAELTDWNSLYDDRIATAKDHAHVRFSRVVQWIREVWKYSDLSDAMSVEQAVLLYRFDTDGSKSGYDPEAVTKAKYWVARKEAQWGMAAMTFHDYLKVAENVDPELVHSTRPKKSGGRLEAPTQAILRVFSKEIPGPENFELQNAVMRAAIDRNLKGPYVTALCKTVQGMGAEVAQEFMHSIDWTTWQPVFSESKSRSLRRASDPRYKGAATLARASRDIDQISQRVDQSIERGEEVTDAMRLNVNEAMAEIQKLYGKLGNLAAELIHLSTAEPADIQARQKIARMAVGAIMPHGTAKDMPQERAKPAKRPMTVEVAPHRKRWGIIELPTFGVFTSEDWSTLEPHHRFALSLDHDKIVQGHFTNNQACLKETVQLAKLASEKDLNAEELKALISRLTLPRSPIQIITLDRANHRLQITDSGQQYLKGVVLKTIAEVDATRASAKASTDESANQE